MKKIKIKKSYMYIVVLMADSFWIQSERCFINWGWSNRSWHWLEKWTGGTGLL